MKILGIGNAIVDVICKVNEKFISENKEGKIKSMGLFFEKTISSFSRSFTDLLEIL